MSNIRVYNFTISGVTDRHIPGIPGVWPAGSIVSVDEDTNEVVSVWPEGAQPMVAQPPEQPVQESADAPADVALEPVPASPLQGESEQQPVESTLEQPVAQAEPAVPEQTQEAAQ